MFQDFGTLRTNDVYNFQAFTRTNCLYYTALPAQCLNKCYSNILTNVVNHRKEAQLHVIANLETSMYKYHLKPSLWKCASSTQILTLARVSLKCCLTPSISNNCSCACAAGMLMLFRPRTRWECECSCLRARPGCYCACVCALAMPMFLLLRVRAWGANALARARLECECSCASAQFLARMCHRTAIILRVSACNANTLARARASSECECSRPRASGILMLMRVRAWNANALACACARSEC